MKQILPRISIIIPVYNCDAYLAKTLNSILNQSYENYEVICIDDGSEDNSANIVQDFCKIDKRIVLIEQEHKGVSSARINGIRNSSGKYISFVDGDDWIENNMLESLLFLFDEDTDVVVCNFFKEYDGTSHPVSNKMKIAGRIVDKEKITCYTFRREEYYGFTAWLWNKMFRKELINRTGLHALEIGLNNGEDVAFFTDLFLQAREIKYLDKPLYHYQLKGMNIEERVNANTIDLQFDALKAYEYAIDKMERYGLCDEALVWPKRFHCYRATRIVKKLIEFGMTEKISEAKSASKKYILEYEKANKEYPERLEEVWTLVGAE